MTEKELSQLYYLNRECECLQKEIAERRMRIGYKSPVLSGMPKGGERKNYTDDVAAIIDLETMQLAMLQKIQTERLRLEQFIAQIPDAEIRMIVRLRHINGLNWREIGNELYMSHEAARRKYRAYLKM